MNGNTFSCGDTLITSEKLLEDIFYNKHNPLWDLVVITAFDSEQADNYNTALKEKYKDYNDLFRRFRIVQDPPGFKIGNGGSTIHVLRLLSQDLGEAFFQQRILLIHAGGYSGRMPTASVMGKIFTVIPTEKGHITMLDVKLGLTEPFASVMPPGVFVTCADDIQPYRLTTTTKQSLHFGEDFTAIAHPTDDWKLASQHGVYVQDSHHPTECQQVLQKASIETLQKAIPSGEILIDSMFAFSHKITRLLLDWSHGHPNSWQVEIDAYGDFLQALGAQSSPSYIDATKNVLHREIRRSLYDTLRSCSLCLIVLKDSYFVHIGTNREYIDNLTRNLVFIHDLKVREDLCFNSSFGEGSYIPRHSIVEFCDFSCPVDLGEDSILSNCCVEQCTLKLCLPKGIVLQTIPVVNPQDSQLAFITIAFNVDDDIKKVSSQRSNVDEELHYMGVPLGEYCTVNNRSAIDLFPVGEKNCNLFKARLFPLANTTTSSFFATLCQLSFVLSISEQETNEICAMKSQRQYFSLHEILQIRNLPYMLQMKARCQLKFSVNK